MRLVLLAAALLLAACTSEGGDASTPTPTVVATATAATRIPAPTPQPTTDELYRPEAYAETGTRQRVAPSRIPPPSIEAANAEGSLWLEGYVPPDPLPPSVDDVPGSAEPECVEVTDYSRIRSGGFVLDLTPIDRGHPMLGLLPADVADVYREGYKTLVVRMVSLDEARATHVIEVRGSAAERSSGEISWELPFGIEPHDADWVLVATGGRNWGCFVLRVELPGRSVERTIADIEAVFHPEVAVPPGRDATFGASISGGPFPVPNDRSCVEVDGDRSVSGEWLFASGQYEERWRPDWPAGDRTFFVPLHQPRTSLFPEEPLRLEAVLLDDPRHTYTYTEMYGVHAAMPGGGSEAHYLTGFMPPRAGEWAVVATAGPNRGCFVLEVG